MKHYHESNRLSADDVSRIPLPDFKFMELSSRAAVALQMKEHRGHQILHSSTKSDSDFFAPRRFTIPHIDLPSRSSNDLGRDYCHPNAWNLPSSVESHRGFESHLELVRRVGFAMPTLVALPCFGSAYDNNNLVPSYPRSMVASRTKHDMVGPALDAILRADFEEIYGRPPPIDIDDSSSHDTVSNCGYSSNFSGVADFHSNVSSPVSSSSFSSPSFPSLTTCSKPSNTDDKVISPSKDSDTNSVSDACRSEGAENRTSRLWTCTHCGSSYRRKSSFIRHNRLQTCGRTWMCTKCPMTFNRQRLWKAHLLTHNSRASIKCDVCEIGFRRRADLLRHMLIHSSQKPFSCEVCGKSFKRKDALKSHTASHQVKSASTCSICQRAFFTKRGYQLHMQRVHPMAVQMLS